MIDLEQLDALLQELQAECGRTGVPHSQRQTIAAMRTAVLPAIERGRK